MCTENEGTGLEQELITEIEGEKIYTAGVKELARKSAAEGCVLLENNGVLPLSKGKMISVFGRCQTDTFFVGYGSGGNVHPPEKVSLLDGLRNCEDITINEDVAEIYTEWCGKKENLADPGKEWGKWPYFYPEMPLEEKLVAEAAAKTETAVIILGRAAGEERENFLGAGSYYLTEEEKRMLSFVTNAFAKTVVVLNCGNIIDMGWIKEYKISALLMMWLPGMEAGNAVADILSGRVNPSGKLNDTVASVYEDYPSAANFGNKEYNLYEEDIYVGYRYFETFAREKILYSFGYGLSYTTFSVVPVSCKEQNEFIEITGCVTNTGRVSGKEVVQLYLEAPQGKLGREKKSLLAFEKTEELAPGESQEITVKISAEQLAAFDDLGKTGCKNAYVLEQGKYQFFFGFSNGEGKLAYGPAGSFENKEFRLFRQLSEVCPVQQEFERIFPAEDNTCPVIGKEIVPKSTVSMKQRISDAIPKEIPAEEGKTIHFSDVVKGNATVEAFTAQLTMEELEALTRGECGMDRPLGVGGNAGVYGGFLPSLQEKGIPVIVTADGPAGLRIKRYTSLLPCGTALACTWNLSLVESLFEKIADELERFDVDVILSPGLNIHRNHLCGRNFEYFSEDPYMSGKMAAAAVRGIQRGGRSACPKHFACNNQEVNRHHNNSVVSGRALREIYLRGFEICVKESAPKNLMMSYNKINGVWSHYNYDLAKTILRDEWKFDGVIMTDWWMQKSASPEFPSLRDNAYRVRACVDVLMPGSPVGTQETEYISDGTLLETLDKPEGITKAELQRVAVNVLKYAVCVAASKQK